MRFFQFQSQEDVLWRRLKIESRPTWPWTLEQKQNWDICTNEFFYKFSSIDCTYICLLLTNGLIDRCMQHFYLWRNVLSTAPSFILRWWKLEILFDRHRGGQRCYPFSNGTQSEHKGEGVGGSLDSVNVSMNLTKNESNSFFSPQRVSHVYCVLVSFGMWQVWLVPLRWHFSPSHETHTQLTADMIVQSPSPPLSPACTLSRGRNSHCQNLNLNQNL
jgi:hypothetical protein